MKKINKTQIDGFDCEKPKEKDIFLSGEEQKDIQIIGSDGEVKICSPAIGEHEAIKYARLKLGLFGEIVFGIYGCDGNIFNHKQKEHLKIGKNICLGTELAHCEKCLTAELETILTGIVGVNRVEIENHLPLWMLDTEEEGPETGVKGFIDFCSKKQYFGLLVEAITPVPLLFFSNSGFFAGDWNYTAHHWFYDESIDRIWEKAQAWRVAYINRCIKEAMK